MKSFSRQYNNGNSLLQGLDDSAPRLTVFCGEEGIQVREFTSTTNVFFIRFRSDDQGSSRGFIIYHRRVMGNPYGNFCFYYTTGKPLFFFYF